MEKSNIVQTKHTFLSSCGVSPLSVAAYEGEVEFARTQRDLGSVLFFTEKNPFDAFRSAAARLLKAPPENIAFVSNCAEGLNLIADGYPFEPGDEIITYVHEYPSNYYPWVQQKGRGVNLQELPNTNFLGEEFDGLPVAWSMKDLERLVTAKTKILALSHVQFCSGFAADLRPLAEFCKSKGIDLVLDAAQSVGCMPLFPEELGISAVVSSGWKWLLGPLGSGILYTSAAFRKKLHPVWPGPGMMRQGDDFLDHSWNPHDSSLRFEYSTKTFSGALGLARSIEKVHLEKGIDTIWSEVLRLREICLSALDRSLGTLVDFPAEHRSGILSVKLKSAHPVAVAKALIGEGVVLSTRGGYLRIAPHFYIEEAELREAIKRLSKHLATLTAKKS